MARASIQARRVIRAQRTGLKTCPYGYCPYGYCPYGYCPYGYCPYGGRRAHIGPASSGARADTLRP